MPEPTKLTIRHDDDGQVIISGITLILFGPAHEHGEHAGQHVIGADALTSLANGETGAALGAALSSLLDHMAIKQPKAAAEALGIARELAARIVTARNELRAEL